MKKESFYGSFFCKKKGLVMRPLKMCVKVLSLETESRFQNHTSFICGRTTIIFTVDNRC